MPAQAIYHAIGTLDTAIRKNGRSLTPEEALKVIKAITAQVKHLADLQEMPEECPRCGATYPKGHDWSDHVCER